MKNPLSYLRASIPHNSPIRLWYSRLTAVIARITNPLPGKMPLIIGVTGTDGKTTTVEMLAHILQERSIPAITASSYATKHSGAVLSMSKRTTPSAKAIRTLLQKAAKEGVEVVVLEVSSHALSQWRILGLQFDVAILTNITHEHLNFHKTIKNYANTKKLLFTKYLKSGGTMVLPTNDTYGSQWVTELAMRGTVLPYSPQDTNAITDKHGTAFIYKSVQYQMPMLGNYNAGNAIAAALAVSALTLPSKQAKKAKYPRAASLASQFTSPCFAFSVNDALMSIGNFAGIPGRMQLISTGQTTKSDLTAIVDFALTAKAMQGALASAREIAYKNKVILVFGVSGGQHDSSVHKGLAEAAAQEADICIVTDDEPYESDPAELRTNLINYIKETSGQNKKLGSLASKFEYHNIGDRRAAIAKALSLADNGDVVIVTGMGHYTSRTVNGTEEPWSDVAVIKEELAKIPN